MSRHWKILGILLWLRWAKVSRQNFAKPERSPLLCSKANTGLLSYIQCYDQWSDTMPLTMASIRSRICCKTSKRGTWLCFVYKCLNFDLSGDHTVIGLWDPPRGQSLPASLSASARSAENYSFDELECVQELCKALIFHWFKVNILNFLGFKFQLGGIQDSDLGLQGPTNGNLWQIVTDIEHDWLA